MYLLDTSFVVNFLRQKQNAVSVMQDISDEQLFLSVIVNVEMFRGFYFTYCSYLLNP